MTRPWLEDVVSGRIQSVESSSSTPLILHHLLEACDVFKWQVSRDEKTEARQFGFFVAPRAVREVMEAEARGDGAKSKHLADAVPANAWIYGVLLHGDAKTYEKEKIGMFRGHDLIEVASGRISVDFEKRVITIALEIVDDGKRMPFPGNGTFSFAEPSKP